MSKGKRYEEPKLNMKKVFAVILAIVVIIMSVFIIKGVFSREQSNGGITSKTYFASYKDNKWGVINEDGTVVLEPTYERENEEEPLFIGKYYQVQYGFGEVYYTDMNNAYGTN